MDEQEVRKKIALGEDGSTEFKREDVPNEKLVVAMVAFANAAGGQILLGVDDNGAVLGVSNADKAVQRIDNLAVNNIKPAIRVRADKVRIDDKVVVVVHVPKGPERPYCTNDGRHFIRTTSGNSVATRQDLLLLFQSAESLRPDEMVVGNAEMSDLDELYLTHFLERDNPSVASDIRSGHVARDYVLESMKFVREGRPTVAGLNCFGRQPADRVPFYKLSAVRFRGTEVSEVVLSRADFGGKIEEQIRGVENFVKATLPAPCVIKGFESELPRTVPLEAIREAVVNAVAHRDYLASSHVRVFIFDDRLEVVSPGRLLNTVSVDSMRFGVHAARNAIILAFLQKIGLASNLGTGVPRMFRLMRDTGLPEPEIHQAGPEVKITMRLILPGT